MSDVLTRGRLTLKWFTRPSLVGDLCDELEATRAQVRYWQERALQMQDESAANRALLVMLRASSAPAPRPGLWARLRGRT